MKPPGSAGRTFLFALLVLGTGPPATADLVSARPGDSLSRLAASHLGSALDWPAILLATNGRLTEGLGLRFLADPNDLAVGQKIWVPDRAEADHLLAQWRRYELAIRDMSLPEPWEVRRDLVIPPDGAVYVTWARGDQFKEPLPTAAASSIWVTVEPYLRDFCRRLEAGHSRVERLEQRLGMPPKSDKTRFVRLQVDLGDLFRPCTDPRVDRSECRLPADGLRTVEGWDWYPMWFYKQYHAAYGTARPARYPWTSLGYTYDWGQSDEVGEAEFVILEGTPIRVLETVPTDEYCDPAADE